MIAPSIRDVMNVQVIHLMNYMIDVDNVHSSNVQLLNKR